MSEMVCCPLSGCDEQPSFCRVRMVVAAKEHVCVECTQPIKKGALHEVIIQKWWPSTMLDTFRTCTMCKEIRDHFSCGRGWLFGHVWSDLEEFFFPTMKAGGPCMKGLSPAAKAVLFERRLKWLEETAE